MANAETIHAASSKGLSRKKKWFSYSVLFILPSFILYTLFVIYPTLNSINLSFTSWDGVSDKIHYIGLDNFVEMFHSERVYNALKNTLILSVSLVVLENVVALLLAVLVDQVRWFKSLFRSVFYFPVLLSGIVMGFVWTIIFNFNFGVISQLLDRMGLGDWKIDWLGDPNYALLAIIITTVWKGSGYYMIIYLAGLQGIPPELNEAASIDGANSWQKFRHITFPLLAGAMTVSVMLSMIGALKIFDQIAVMTDGGPGFATETLTYIVYKVGFGELRQGYGTAMSMVLFVLILIVSLIQIKLLKKREVQM
ncbi:multiple sugar transport system permease protein/raffinose/stachyose/melibiose transport system permease protein [Paenibacillus cellulosilyticus]|uniref:Multiple sugar transport system permease protein/raffinose/stachyose/melibiose transport system permease protein n=1 Tax=Paenibacillus cellulosilyticus TaxID=375489 RepID=A0A2V2YE88_9BACL|nr:sugar ABC transporter permease [Paenibacillus cellulosilyticus]PWV90607.1 multiple sugar transport system permease protein/raffinose/stachyose/melibiose transport system permease protein [Paenibacillus cellulosilyticus]QKS45228.1 sugar ABC transporter permease [Paenibacillus cellulosilyticus]